MMMVITLPQVSRFGELRHSKAEGRKRIATNILRTLPHDALSNFIQHSCYRQKVVHRDSYPHVSKARVIKLFKSTVHSRGVITVSHNRCPVGEIDGRRPGMIFPPSRNYYEKARGGC